MTASSARCFTESSARRPVLRPPVKAMTAYDAGSRPTRSSVFSPIQPVAPSTEMRRGRVTGEVGLMVSECMASTVIRNASPDKQPTTGIGRIAQGDQCRRDCGDEKAIDAVEQPTVAGDEIAHVLGSKPALRRALAQIADLTRRGDGHADQGQAPARGLPQKPGKSKSNQRRRKGANQKPAPGLSRRDLRGEFRAADQPAPGIGR